MSARVWQCAALLQARSPVFERMFYGGAGMKEAVGDADVHVEDAEPAIVDSFLDFLYSGEVLRDFQKALHADISCGS